MKLDGDYVFDAGVQEVWDALFDPQVLAAVLPGCEKLDLVDGAYIGELKVKVGPIQGKFTGKVDLLDKIEPKSYRMVVDGRGAQGFVKANATIALEAIGATTKIRYESEAQVGGKIASVGQRLVETSARAIVAQSLLGLNDNIKIRAEAYRAHAAMVPAPVAEAAPVEPVEAKPVEAKPVEAKPVEAKPVEAKAVEAKPVEAVAAKPVEAVAAKAVVAAKPVTPAIEYKRADAGKLASAVAKEVGKTLAPLILLALAIVGVVIYLLVR